MKSKSFIAIIRVKMMTHNHFICSNSAINLLNLVTFTPLPQAPTGSNKLNFHFTLRR